MPQSKSSHKSFPPLSSAPRTTSLYVAIFAAQAINEDLTTQKPYVVQYSAHTHAVHASNIPALCLCHVGILCVQSSSIAWKNTHSTSLELHSQGVFILLPPSTLYCVCLCESGCTCVSVIDCCNESIEVTVAVRVWQRQLARALCLLFSTASGEQWPFSATSR